jgi:Spy/CpxP family protein refolding chaperone
MGRMHSPGISGKLLGLLRIEEVRNELDLEEDQIQQLKDIAKMLRKGMPVPLDKRNLSPEERRAKLNETHKKALKHSEKFREQIKEVLTSDQFKRLEQIEFQVRLKIRGAGVLADKKLAEKLGITDEQKKKFRELRQQLTGKMREFGEELRNTDPAERAEKEKELHQRLAEVRKEVFKQAFEVLTYEQRETLEEMKGEPFELDLSKVMKPIGGMRMGPGGMRRGPGEMRRGPGGRRGGPGMQLRMGPPRQGPPREPRE